MSDDGATWPVIRGLVVHVVSRVHETPITGEISSFQRRRRLCGPARGIQ